MYSVFIHNIIHMHIFSSETRFRFFIFRTVLIRPPHHHVGPLTISTGFVECIIYLSTVKRIPPAVKNYVLLIFSIHTTQRVWGLRTKYAKDKASSRKIKMVFSAKFAWKIPTGYRYTWRADHVFLDYDSANMIIIISSYYNYYHFYNYTLESKKPILYGPCQTSLLSFIIYIRKYLQVV